jgi:hypothetical protein
MIIDERLKGIHSKLKSKDQEILLKTIDLIRENGNSLIISDIIDLLHNTEFEDIKKSVLNLLSELKHQESVSSLMAAVNNQKYADERKDLLACCWQNGLKYNEYLPLLIDLVIDEEFMVAFEAFTVIENMYGRVEDEVIDAQVIKINNVLNNTDDQKTYLLNGLLTIIQDIPEKQEFTD